MGKPRVRGLVRRVDVYGLREKNRYVVNTQAVPAPVNRPVLFLGFYTGFWMVFAASARLPVLAHSNCSIFSQSLLLVFEGSSRWRKTEKKEERKLASCAMVPLKGSSSSSPSGPMLVFER